MKRKRTILALLCMMTIAAFFSMNSEAKQKKIVELSENTAYTTYDITGDKKADKIMIQRKTGSSVCKIFINDKCCAKIKGKVECDYCDASILSLNERTKFLYLVVGGFEEYGSGYEQIYQYVNGRLVKKLNPVKISEDLGISYRPLVNKVTKDSVNMSLFCTTAEFGDIRFDVTYKYKNGVFKTSGKTYEIKKYVRTDGDWEEEGSDVLNTKEDRPYLTASQTLQLYKSALSNQKAFKIKEGTKLRLLKVRVGKKHNAYYITTESGKKGWCVLPKKNDKQMVSDGYGEPDDSIWLKHLL